MIKLEKPDFDQGEILDACMSNMRTREGKPRARIEASRDAIIAESDRYDRLAESGKLTRIKRHSLVDGGATKKDMVELYDRKFARSGQGGRIYYDRIRLLAPYDRCPFCGQRDVSTLDHYLAKTEFPSYSVTPYNLIPSCSDCNKEKLTEIFRSREDETIHPYYDDFTDEVWIKARVVEEEPVTFEFYVGKPKKWDLEKYRRAKHHFEVFGLNDLYKPHACERFCEVQPRLRELVKQQGMEAGQEYIRECIKEKRSVRLNTWEAAMYDALLESEWFWGIYLKGKSPCKNSPDSRKT